MIRLSEIVGRAPKLRRIAHDPRNFIDTARQPPERVEERMGFAPQNAADDLDAWDPPDQWVEQKLRPHLRFTVKEGEHWETKLTFVYTVDQVALANRIARLAHLTLQMSVPGHMNRGDVNLESGPFMASMEPVVRLFFPLAPTVGQRIQALDPIPVSRGGVGNVVFRTPVLFHFFVDHDDPDRLFREEAQARRKVTLYGPDGKPISQ